MMSLVSTNNSEKTLAVVGQGYVGLPLAMAAVDAGWKVIGVDSLHGKVSQLNSGTSPVEDIEDDRLKSALSSERYRATSDFADVSSASVVTLCVPTPLDSENSPDLSMLVAAAHSVAPYVKDETLIVSESTSHPGTLREIIIPIFESMSNKALYFASAPERVNPGDKVWSQKNTPRLVGAIDEESQAKAMSFYNSICDASISVSSPEVAEAAKLLENTFRLVNIALINEFTKITSSAGINIHEVVDAASTKPYGFMEFRPGVGVGGHCIPVDPLYLTSWARKNGSKVDLVELSSKINHEMPSYVAKKAIEIVAEKSSSPKILLLGVAYKAGVADTRETPALKLLEELRALGASVFWYDPLVFEWEKTKPTSPDSSFDLAILVTRQPGIDTSKIIDAGVPILDCTNTMDINLGVHTL
jgi:UDP-N-acetyl-D-glucosamine dehydrogenase